MSISDQSLLKDWKIVELKDIGQIVTGSTPPKARKDFYGGDFPFVKPGELRNCAVSESQDRLSHEGALVADVAPANSILVSCIGNLGKIGRATCAVAFNQQINAIIPNDMEYSKWIFYAVQTLDFASQLADVSSATTIAIVNKSKFSKLQIPFAPLDEQRRIVAEIEKQFTRLDVGVAALKRVQANLKRYRAAVLKAACEGRLVPTEAELARAEGRDYESAKVLLQRILTERREKWNGRGKYKEPVAPDVAGPPELPEGWAWATLTQLGELNRGKSKHRPRDDSRLYDGDYPFIQTGDVRKSGGTITTYKQTYSEFGLQQSRIWPIGTLCITIAANIAETGILQFSACFPDSVVGFVHEMFRPLTRYVEFFLRTAKEDLERFAPATAQKNINLAVLQSVAVPLPPLAELERIVTEVERVFSIVEELETTVTANMQRATRLRQAILQKAFSGALS